MATQKEPQRMTVEEWRELERNSHDIKHEYVDGQAYAVIGGSLSHSRIGINTSIVLEDMLNATGKQCYVYNSNVVARLSPECYTYPDVQVSCNEQDRPANDETDVRFPCVIVEVFSDTTEAYDRGRKFDLYRACPTVQEYMLVAVRHQSVEVHRRTSKGWTDSQFYEPGDEIELTSLGIQFPMAEFYRNAGVPETIDDPEGEV